MLQSHASQGAQRLNVIQDTIKLGHGDMLYLLSKTSPKKKEISDSIYFPSGAVISKIHYTFTTRIQVHKHMIGTTCYTYFTSSLNRKLIRQLEMVKHIAATFAALWSARMLIEACLKQMTAGRYRAQSPRIHLQCWHLKHLMFILWRRWDNPLSERHKHSTLGTWLLALSPIQPTWVQRTVVFIQDNSSPKMEHWEREDKGKWDHMVICIS